MATRISSAESIRLALQKDALVASILEVISVDISGRAPVALGPSAAVKRIPSIDGLEAVWDLEFIGLTDEEASIVADAIRALFIDSEVSFTSSKLTARIYSLVTPQLKAFVEEAKKEADETKRIARVESAVEAAKSVRDGRNGATGLRGPQGLQGPLGEPGDRGPQGLPGRDGKDLVATDAELNDLKDVFVEDSKVGQVLTYDGTSWVSRYAPQVTKGAFGSGMPPGGADGDLLTWVAANNRFEAITPGSGGSGILTTTSQVDGGSF
jgi:hypothetical protein